MARRATKDRKGKAPTQRQLRVGEEIRHALSDIMLRAAFRDPELAGRVITVTEVRISPDLRNATAFVLPLEGEAAPMVAALNRAGAYLRGQLARPVTLKYLPSLQFVHDERFDEATRIDRIMHSPQVQQDLARPTAGQDADADPDADPS